MSFPRLVLEGSVTNHLITDIRLEYPNDNTASAKSTTLTRVTYNIKRDLRNKAVGSGVPNQYPDVPYDQCRYVHTWIGFADVITDSVAYTPFSDDITAKTIALLKSSIFLQKIEGIHFSVPTFVIEGPSQSSSTNTMVEGYEQGLTWEYWGHPDPERDYTTVYWVVKNITIDDNLNNTSRVTFTFTISEPWVYMPEILIEH